VKRLIPLLAAAALLAGAPGASAAVKVSGGKTTLTLDKGTAKALRSLGVSVTPTGRAVANGRKVTFPITGGRIDPATAAGTIAHKGGLRLKAGHTSIVLADYRLKVGKRILLSARVGKSRVTILRLTGAPKVTRKAFATRVSGLSARLTRKAARALNATFGVHAFAAGLKLGRVKVDVRPAETQLEATGATALAIDPGALSALASLGIAPGVIAPATLAGTTASFPIAGGRADLDLGAGVIRHRGGISLTKGSTVVRLTDFDVRLGSAPQLFASINGAASKAAILDLDLSGVTPQVSGRTITLAGVGATLTPGAATALNGAFSTTAFTAGLVLGRATVRATGR
jgi:hypothetical protein